MSLFDKLKSWFAPAPPGGERANAEVASNEDVGEDAAAPQPLETGPRKRWSAKDDAELEARARTLFVSGNASDAMALLGGANLLARHETTRLPCLCAKCLKHAADSPEVDGVRYVRDFVVARYRVLFYWTPEELAADAKQVRASMRSALRAQLRIGPQATRAPGINPFTGRPTP
ncbi:MAG: hypothetical protein HOO96_38750 [Polyangiaceae bacterium]|nr:hypothetical protein [Polyangiaceae bacterium]